MIIDRIENAPLYFGLGERFERGLKEIMKCALSHSANYATATVLAYCESDETTSESSGSTGGDGYADPTCG